MAHMHVAWADEAKGGGMLQQRSDDRRPSTQHDHTLYLHVRLSAEARPSETNIYIYIGAGIGAQLRHVMGALLPL